jgi:microcompartment protein CcmK/EutM
MIIAKVVGTVVATVKHPVLVGCKLLVVQPVDPTGEPRGRVMVGVDTVRAGRGDTVLVLDEGNSARMMLGDPEAPVRTVIAGIVDAVSETEAP